MRASFRFTGTQKGKEEPKEKINNTKKKKTEIYRMKEVVFKKEGKDFIMYQKIKSYQCTSASSLLRNPKII